jgi:myo-inositol-1(or 4)-monophosphatase
MSAIARNDALRDALVGVMAEARAVAQQAAPRQATRKAHQDYVTDIDLAVDACLQQALERILPGVPVLSEERAVAAGVPGGAYWIVDPLDGTGNLVAGLPFTAISVALADARGPQLAAVAALGQDLLYTAQCGGGAFCNGQSLRLPAAPPELVVLSTGLMDAILAAPDGPARWAALRQTGKLRNLGAQALHLCGVAAGQFAAVASHEARVWDEAAAGLILREAGGLWHSAADRADWGDPAALMAIRAQRSLACHPVAAPALRAALAGLVAA